MPYAKSLCFFAKMDNRYKVQQRLPFCGIDGQRRLSEASVLVIGAGGLGCPVLVNLVGAGVGNIGIVDADTVSLDNLHRQFLFAEQDIGKPKVEVAKHKLFEYNSSVHVRIYPVLFSQTNALKLVRDYDLIIDCTDNLLTRYTICDACFVEDKPWVSGALHRTEGRVMLFNFPDRNAPNYRDLFPSTHSEFSPIDCSTAGLLPSLSTIIGAMMANEAIYVIIGMSKLSGKMLIFDTQLYASFSIDIEPRIDNPLRLGQISGQSLSNYTEICASSQPNDLTMIKECTVQELHRWLLDKRDVVLIDVREPSEAAIVSIGGVLIPMSEIAVRFNEIPLEKTTVVYCRSGIRSANVIRYLQDQKGYNNLVNLKGGILNWIEEIDPNLPSY